MLQFDPKDFIVFALLLPLFQLGLFSFIIYQGIKSLTSVLDRLTSLIDILGEALIEEKQTYRRIRELIGELENGRKHN